jgi:hypothetical protein
MAVTINSIEKYSLMARCLRGESSSEEDRQLAGLINSDPLLLKEYQFFKTAMQRAAPSVGGDSAEDDLQAKFDHISCKLKDDGSL